MPLELDRECELPTDRTESWEDCSCSLLLVLLIMLVRLVPLSPLADWHRKGAPLDARRRKLINVPGRVAATGCRLVLHLPTHWPWADAWEALHAVATSPPRTATP